jgi:hypothetical protein
MLMTQHLQYNRLTLQRATLMTAGLTRGCGSKPLHLLHALLTSASV